MGCFYTNLTLRSTDTERIVQSLTKARRTALVAPPIDGFTVVYDEASESQKEKANDDLARHLTSQLDCAGLVAINHDDDILWLALYERGTLVDEYDSTPGYFGGETGPPKGGDAARICRALGAEQKENEVEAALRHRGPGEFSVVSAMQRHHVLAEVLGLPMIAVGSGFNYIEEGDLPEGIEESDLRRTG
jgi:hypothetical protein